MAGIFIIELSMIEFTKYSMWCGELQGSPHPNRRNPKYLALAQAAALMSERLSNRFIFLLILEIF